MGADETQIESSFCEAIRVAKEQKSVLWAKRAEATYAEYRRQKASAAGGRGFRLPLLFFYDFLVRAVFSLPYALVRPNSAQSGADVRVRTSGGKRRAR